MTQKNKTNNDIEHRLEIAYDRLGRQLTSAVKCQKNANKWLKLYAAHIEKYEQSVERYLHLKEEYLRKIHNV